MFDEFWKATAGKLADRWAGLAAPAVVFWAGAVISWAYAGPGWTRLVQITDWLNRQQLVAQLAALIGALVVGAASTILVQRLTTPALRLLEGYWPRCMSRLTEYRRGHALRGKINDGKNWQRLHGEIAEGEPAAAQLAEIARLERRRRHRPVRDSELLPTRIGNILRAAETRPRHRFGLDVVLIWPRVWILLPETVRQELASARASLDASVAVAIWGTLFIVFVPLTWWALLGLVVPVSAVVWWVPARAEVFADLVEATVELYRVTLYRQLRWPLPENPAAERGDGERLTKYLERGSDRPDPEFTPPD
ncbi:hypothetical protein ACFVJ5_07455 [Nocardia sp. NPDC127606]|uniref:hypothetical protein n=1 Tax=Nocardia sp. NPDC127606 TaxID=3345406 RepID=UPI00363E2FC2